LQHNFPLLVAFEWVCPQARGLEQQMATRRAFMKGGAMALVGTSVVPAFLRQSVLAQTTSAQAQGKKLVVIFQRGAADGLNIVVPHAETNYYQLRPTIAIPQNQLIDLDGFFGLHPAMQSFKPLFPTRHAPILTLRISWKAAPQA
jgi:uncharacterized protein (DUF1501 family)